MQRRPNIMRLFLVASLVVLCDVGLLSAGMLDEPVLLRVRLNKGDAFRYALTSTTTQDMTVAMNDITNEATSAMKIRFVVNEAALDRAEVTATLSDVTSSVRVRGMDDLGIARDTTMRLTQFEGMNLRFSMDQFGRATKSSTSLDGSASSFIASMKMFDRFSSYLPKEPMVPGGTWTITNTDTTAAPSGTGDVRSTVTMQFTYRGVRDTLGVRCWVIDALSTSLQQEGTITTNGIELELEGTGQSSGTSYLDVANGMVVAFHGKLAMQTQMSLSGQQSMVVPVATTMTYAMTRVSERR